MARLVLRDTPHHVCTTGAQPEGDVCGGGMLLDTSYTVGKRGTNPEGSE